MKKLLKNKKVLGALAAAVVTAVTVFAVNRVAKQSLIVETVEESVNN